MIILTSYFELLAAYDGLSSAIDYLENDGMKKWEEITRDVDYAYSRLQFYGREDITPTDDAQRFDAATSKIIPEMWLY